jgi:hypothetical protein
MAPVHLADDAAWERHDGDIVPVQEPNAARLITGRIFPVRLQKGHRSVQVGNSGRVNVLSHGEVAK